MGTDKAIPERIDTREVVVATVVRLLRDAGIETAAREAAWIFEHVTGLGRAAMLAFPAEPVDAASAARVLELARRRATREPLQYVLGVATFFGRDFDVDPSVLIPRPETEGLVEAVLGLLRPGDRVLDVGTGSGCVAVTIALERGGTSVDACDVSAFALDTARRNAARLEASVRFIEADVFDPGFPCRTFGPYRAVVSNPPYIPDRDRDGLQPEVVLHEPHLALFSGDDPLAFHRRLAHLAVAGLVEAGGYLVCEVHDDTGTQAAEVWTQTGLDRIVVHRDLAGRERVIVGRVRPAAVAETRP